MEHSELVSIIRRALNLPEEYDLSTSAEIRDVPGWDSLGWIFIVSEIEESLGSEVDLSSLDSLQTLGDLAAYVQSQPTESVRT